MGNALRMESGQNTTDGSLLLLLLMLLVCRNVLDFLFCGAVSLNLVWFVKYEL